MKLKEEEIKNLLEAEDVLKTMIDDDFGKW